MRKGQIHPSTYLYKNMISDALMALLKEKKICSVTITELCEKAQVSRRTFYRHFSDKTEVVDYYVTKIMKNMESELRGSLQDKRSLVLTFFNFMKPYTQLLVILSSNGLGDTAFTSYIKCVAASMFSGASPQKTCRNSSQYNMAFLMGGLWSLLTYWILNGCQKTPAELANIVCAS